MFISFREGREKKNELYLSHNISVPKRAKNGADRGFETRVGANFRGFRFRDSTFSRIQDGFDLRELQVDDTCDLLCCCASLLFKNSGQGQALRDG